MKPLKGNAIVGQSGGCTPVINCSLLGVIEGVKKHRCIPKLYGMWHGVAGLLDENFTDLGKQNKKTLKSLYFTPSAALGSCRYKLEDQDIQKALQVIKKHDIRYFYLIGGNDSADTSLKICEQAKKDGYELRVIAIPKTIDNDLPLTDHCPGYGSVARFVAQTTQEAGLDTKAMKMVDPFKVIEVMGRNSGWIVAASALGKNAESDAPHLMYFPERRFDHVPFLKDVEEVYKKVGYVVIVISEAIRDTDGKRVGEKISGVKDDPFGHAYVDNTANVLCQLLEKHFKKRARFDKPGTIQRMATPYLSAVDQEEAFQLGRYAVDISVQGKTGLMVILLRKESKRYQVSYSAVRIDEIANKEKYLPDNFINARGNFITEEFIQYAKPLIGSPLPDFSVLK